jgi:hypothetical protein
VARGERDRRVGGSGFFVVIQTPLERGDQRGHFGGRFIVWRCILRLYGMIEFFFLDFFFFFFFFFLIFGFKFWSDAGSGSGQVTVI